MSAIIAGKVTALIVRPSPYGHELLLFQHPHAGIQIPAGTIEADEAPEAAVLREAAEETGLTDFESCSLLGYHDDMLPADKRVTVQPTLLSTRSNGSHSYGLTIRSGITVRVIREANQMAQISYEEWDQQGEPPYISYQLVGWTPLTNLAMMRRRYFFLLRSPHPTPATWQVDTDHHRFTLFWAPLDALPALQSPQDSWLAWLPAALRQ